MLSVLTLQRKYPLLNASVLNDCVCIPFFLSGCGSICTISSRRLLNKSLLIAIHPISSTTGSTTGTLAPIALFCFTSSFKNTMFVRICIFYRSLSQMGQYDNTTTWTVMMTLSVSYETEWWCVQRERLIPSSLFNLWTGLYWTTMYNQTGWKLSYCIQCIPFIMLQFCTYIFF